jgi:hypothetical protein
MHQPSNIYVAISLFYSCPFLSSQEIISKTEIIKINYSERI